MSMYYEGYAEAVKSVKSAELPELISHLDALYGRDSVEDLDNVEEVLREVLRQVKKDFTNKESEEYKAVSFWVGLVGFMEKQDCLNPLEKPLYGVLAILLYL